MAFLIFKILIMTIGIVALQLASVFFLDTALNNSIDTYATSRGVEEEEDVVIEQEMDDDEEQWYDKEDGLNSANYMTALTSAAVAATETNTTGMVTNDDDVGYQYSRSSSYINCMLNLEKNELSPERIAQLEESNLPIPFAVKIDNNNRFWVLAMLHHDNHFLRTEDIYYCNGIQAQIAKTFITGYNMLAVACSETIDARNSSLNTFSGRPKPKSQKGMEFSFDMQAFETCERKDIESFSHLSDENKNVKIGIVAVFTGNRKEAFEWAVYHHTIGVDHIFLYVNEDWDEGKDLFHRDYITWIPYNFHVTKRGPFSWRCFREAGMTDMVWRARRLKMNWLANVDIDEFIWVNGTLYPDKKPLHTFLNTNPIPDKYGAFELNSIPFGGNSTNSSSSISKNQKHEEQEDEGKGGGAPGEGGYHHDKSLVMEYVYRQNRDVKTFPRKRYKIIIDTTKIVTAISCHYIGGGSSKNAYPLDADVMRVNHYKLPKNGVFNTLYSFLPPSQVMRDSDLMDRFFDAVSKEMTL